jgi:hypothetical protein
METKEKKAIAKEVVKLLLKQKDRNEVRNYDGFSLTAKQKAFLDKGYWKGWKIVGTFKESKDYKGQTKEYEGLEMEKDGKVLKPLWVNAGSVLRVWD